MIDVWNRVMTNIVTAGGSTIAKVTSTTSNTPDEFPAVAVEQIDNPDAALDLENSENGVYSVIQIQAFSNKNLTEARNVMDIVCDAMRTMGFVRTFGPNPLLNMSDTKIYRTIARFRRFVGSIDDIPKFHTNDSSQQNQATNQ